jgi:Peptidase MA superfamily
VGVALSAATPLRRLTRTLVVMLALMALLAPAAAVRGITTFATFGQTQVKATYNQSLVFSVPYTSTAATKRVEIRLGFPDTLGPFIADVQPPTSTGTAALGYTLDLTADGHMVPNTTLTITWAAYDTHGDAPVVSDSLTYHYLDTSHSWQTVSGPIVTVHWYDGTDAFARQALAIGEKAIADTSKLLGVTETQRIDFYIYGDDASFRAALGPGTRENVGGQAHADIRTLFALITPGQINDSWVGIVIPHELTHLVFDTAIKNPYRFPPRWLNEGLAVYLSQGYDASDRGLVASAVSTGDLIPLTALTGQFPTDAQKTYLAYAESVSAIDYLVSTKGQPALVNLVLAYKAGLTDDEAFTKALGMDVAAFQQGWLAANGATAPKQYGPQPDPSGPVPPGWDAAGASASPAGSVTPGASASAAPSDGTAATPAPTTAPSSGGSGGGDMTLVLLAIVVVAGAMLLGLVLAGRRASAP